MQEETKLPQQLKVMSLLVVQHLMPIQVLPWTSLRMSTTLIPSTVCNLV
jgi:hypothetical protein